VSSCGCAQRLLQSRPIGGATARPALQSCWNVGAKHALLCLGSRSRGKHRMHSAARLEVHLDAVAGVKKALSSTQDEPGRDMSARASLRKQGGHTHPIARKSEKGEEQHSPARGAYKALGVAVEALASLQAARIVRLFCGFADHRVVDLKFLGSACVCVVKGEATSKAACQRTMKHIEPE